MEHPVLELGGHLAPVRILGQGEAANEAPIGAFNPVILLPFFFLLECPLAGHRQDLILHRQAHILFLHVRQLGLNEVFLLILRNVHQGRPLGYRQGFLAPMARCLPSAQQRRQPAFQVLPVIQRIVPGSEGVPAQQCVHGLTPLVTEADVHNPHGPRHA